MMSETEWQHYRSMIDLCRLTLRLRECAKLWAETKDEAVRKLHRLLSERIDARLEELIASGILEYRLFDEGQPT